MQSALCVNDQQLLNLIYLYKKQNNNDSNNSWKHGKLKPLFPFIDDRGLLRVGGRLQNSEFEFNKRHPIIIPRNCHLAWLIIHDCHRITSHGGNQFTLAQIRHQFWIIGARCLVKNSLINVSRATVSVRLQLHSWWAIYPVT